MFILFPDTVWPVFRRAHSAWPCFYFSHPVTPSSGRNIRFQKSKKCFFLGGGSKKTKKMWGGFFGIGENDELPHFSVSSPRRNLSPSRFPKFITFNPSTILKKPLKILKTRVNSNSFCSSIENGNFHSKKARFIWKLANTINSRRFYIFHEHFHVNSVHLKLLRALHVQEQIKYIVYVPLKMFQNIWTSPFPPINL